MMTVAELVVRVAAQPMLGWFWDHAQSLEPTATEAADFD
jgi:hypothetical protein